MVDLSSDDLFPLLVPVNSAAAAVRSDSHLASDGRMETDFERAIGLLAAAHAVEEVLHVRVRGISAAHDVRRCRRRFLRELGTSFTLGKVANVFHSWHRIVPLFPSSTSSPSP